MPQAIFAYHLGMDAEQYAFFRIPKLLITEPYFRRLSTDAKLLYGLMLDRMSLSMRNGWMDDDGHVYIYFTLEEACEQLCCKTDKAVKLFAELDSAKGVGLIRRVKQGLGRPAKIYVLRFMGMEDEPGEDKQCCVWLHKYWLRPEAVEGQYKRLHHRQVREHDEQEPHR